MLSGRALLQWRPASNTDMLTASTSSVTCTQTQWVRGDAALTERARHGGQAGVHSCHTFSGDPRCAATTSGSSHSFRFSTSKWCIAVIVQEGLGAPSPSPRPMGGHEALPAAVRNVSMEARLRGGIWGSTVLSSAVSRGRSIFGEKGVFNTLPLCTNTVFASSRENETLHIHCSWLSPQLQLLQLQHSRFKITESDSCPRSSRGTGPFCYWARGCDPSRLSHWCWDGAHHNRQGLCRNCERVGK